MAGKPRQESSYLRLVHNRRAESSKTPIRSEGHQLAFFYPHRSSVFFVNLPLLEREEFVELITNCRQAWIIDLRAVPRFEAVASSREAAFRLFMRYEVKYLDLFGRLGIFSYHATDSSPVLWSRQVIELFLDSKREGPCLLLFDNEKMMMDTSCILRRSIRRVAGNHAQFAIVGHGGGISAPEDSMKDTHFQQDG